MPSAKVNTQAGPSPQPPRLTPQAEAVLQGAKACVFDFGGTLVDTVSLWNEVDTAFFRKRGLEKPADYYEQMAGVTGLASAERVVREYGLQEDPADVMRELDEAYDSCFAREVQPIPGAVPFLRLLRARGLRVGIATASSHERLGSYFQFHPEMGDLVEVIVSTRDIGGQKPDPEVYLECMRRLGAGPESSVVFEDSASGLRGGRATGARTVCLFTNGSKREEKEALSDLLVGDYNEMILKDEE